MLYLPEFIVAPTDTEQLAYEFVEPVVSASTVNMPSGLIEIRMDLSDFFMILNQFKIGNILSMAV